MKKRIALILIPILLILSGTLVFIGQRREQSAELFYSGTIEAIQANLSFQVSGRVRNVFFDEGQTVEKGRILAELDPAEFTARLEQARAELAGAMKSTEQAKAALELNRKILPADVARAEAGVQALGARVRELEAGFRSQDVEQARLRLAEAETALEIAKREKDRIDALFANKTVSERDRDAANLRHVTALKTWERAKAAYEQQREGFRKEEVDAARARLAEGQAALRQARGNLDRLEVSEREVEIAESRTGAVGAAMSLAEIQLGYTLLYAPFSGILTSRNVEPGEVVSPGREVLSLADLSIVDLKIFVGTTEIGRIKPGEKVTVRIDTFPEKTYTGTVSYISPEAEFTPKFIQTRKERVKLVFLVKISVPNPNYELKPGLPADAWFR